MQIDLALQKGGYEIGRDFQVRGIYGVDAWENLLQWFPQNASAYPEESQALTWWSQVQADEAAAAALLTAKVALKQKADLAKTYKAEIATLWNVCLDQLETNSSHPTRFNNVLNAVNALPTQLKNRVNKGTPDPANASTDALKDAYVDHVHLVAVSLAMLLSLA